MLDSIQSALNDGVKKRELLAWATYDFANSGYTTVVLTAVYSPFFVKVIAHNASWATLAFTVALSISYAVAMFTMPSIGAYADRRAIKKPLLAMTTLACVVSTALLYFPYSGDVLWAMALLVVSNIFFCYGETLAAAFLPELAKSNAMGRVSGWGWSFGYFGGMFALATCLGYLQWIEKKGLPVGEYVTGTMLITAAIYGCAACFTMAILKERAKPQPAALQAMQESTWKMIIRTYQEAKPYQDFRALMACAVAYQAGVAVAIALAAIYAESVMGFAQQETIKLVFVLNITAAIGAFGFGFVQDRIGHQLALGITIVLWIVTCLLAGLGGSKEIFWVAANLAGISMGSSQSAGRAMAGLFAPEQKRTEFFGLWGFATRLASIIGPLSYGLMTWLTNGNHRLAIIATSGFFVVGLLLLRKINVQRGIAMAQM